MRKKWPLLACFLLLVAIGALASLLGHNHRAASEGYNIQCVQPSQPTGATTSLSCTVNPSGDTEKSESKFQWLYDLAAWPEGITAWLLALTLIAIAWQAWETSNAAIAAVESARASFAQLELMKEKERARLGIDYSNGASLNVTSGGEVVRSVHSAIRVRNIGASRAFITRTYGEMVIKESAMPLKRGGDEDHPLSLPETFLDFTPVEVAIYHMVRGITISPDELSQGKFSIHMVGFIEYVTLGMKWRKPFGYDWQTHLDGIEDSANPSIKRMVGTWWPNADWDKEEYPVDNSQSPN